ncbi:MAG: hypothetical protein ACE5FA_11040 [Dehalococcoidia bacterium]
MARDGGLTMGLLRVWLWLMPIVMLVVAVVFAVIAALDERWALLTVMGLLGAFAIGLLGLHWWAMYGFGKGSGTEEEGT